MEPSIGLSPSLDEDIYRVATQLAAITTHEELQTPLAHHVTSPENLFGSRQTNYENHQYSIDYAESVNNAQYDSYCSPRDFKFPRKNSYNRECSTRENNLSNSLSSDSLLKLPPMYSNSPVSEFSDRSDDMSFFSTSSDTYNQISSLMTFKNPNNLYSIDNNEYLGVLKIAGPGLQKAVRGRSSIFYIYTSTNISEKYTFKVKIMSRCGNDCSAHLRKISPTKICAKYRPDYLGLHEISVSCTNGITVKGSPKFVDVESEHNYESDGQIKCIMEGDERKSFTFSEPWGVCCNPNGMIAISDRGNHTLRVFNPNFSLSHSIGSKGSQPGELNKPAGLEFDSQDNIIVADKDNHRIQIFSLSGDAILSFGENGSLPWQFNYPWSVAVTQEDSILVTDSRNGRISMFCSKGNFLKLVVEGNTILKNPRGIIYRDIDNRIITADMNKHQIIAVHSPHSERGSSFLEMNSSHPCYIGSKGKNPHELQRPQGVACDLEGNVLVSDSRNSRIQIIDLDGNFLTNWPIESPEPSIPAQPMGISVTPWGNILVVDSKYNRIIVY